MTSVGPRREGRRSAHPSAAVNACGESPTGGGQADLDGQLHPVDALCVGDAETTGDGGADQRRDDADDDREPHRNVLTAGNDQTAERTDDQADDDGGDDPTDVHIQGFLFTRGSGWSDGSQDWTGYARPLPHAG